MKVLMKRRIGFWQNRAGGGLTRKRSVDSCVLPLLFGFAVAAQAEPISTIGPQMSFGESAASTSQAINTNLAQAAPKEIGTHEGTTKAAVYPSTDAICDAIASAAASNNLPLAFFTRLIWQESRFDPSLVSSKGARGIAQFMPATASWRGLKNPFDPIEAIPKAARLLDELRHEFGNIGLAAAAYNAGSQRIRQWLAHRQALPRETQQYVRVVTGQRAEEWTSSTTATSALERSPDIPCRSNEEPLAITAVPGGLETSHVPYGPGEGGLAKQAPGARFIWGIQLVGGRSRALAAMAWSELKQKYPAILAGREPLFVETKLSGGISWYRVRIGANVLERASALCAQLRDAGASCLVQRN
jgi:hypothetical protein